MESAERLSRDSSRVSSCGEPGPWPAATSTARFLGPRQLLFPVLLALALLAAPANIGPAVAIAQLSAETGPNRTSLEVEPNLSSLEEGSQCNTTLYRQWYNLPYSLSGALLVDVVGFWIFSDAELTNGQVGCKWLEAINCNEQPLVY